MVWWISPFSHPPTHSPQLTANTNCSTQLVRGTDKNGMHRKLNFIDEIVIESMTVLSYLHMWGSHSPSHRCKFIHARTLFSPRQKVFCGQFHRSILFCSGLWWTRCNLLCCSADYHCSNCKHVVAPASSAEADITHKHKHHNRTGTITLIYGNCEFIEAPMQVPIDDTSSGRWWPEIKCNKHLINNGGRA